MATMRQTQHSPTRILQLSCVLLIAVQVTDVQTMNTHVQTAKSKFLREFTMDFDTESQHRNRPGLFDQSDEVDGISDIGRRRGGAERWSAGRRRFENLFTSWSPWSPCSDRCMQVRERFCDRRRKCGSAKHIEERRCMNHRCYNRIRTRSSPHRHYDPYDDEGDFYVVKKPKKQKPKKPKSNQAKKKIIVEVQDFGGSDSSQKDEEDEAEPESEEEEFYKRPISHRRPVPTYYEDNYRHHRSQPHSYRPSSHYRKRHHHSPRRSTLRKKLIWDRASPAHNDPLLSDEEESFSEEDGVEEIPASYDFDDRSNRRGGPGWRTTGVDLPNRPQFNQDLSERLDRNYGAFFEPNSPSTQGVHHRNIPNEYLSREQLDDQFEPSDTQFQRRMDMGADQPSGRSLNDDGPDLDFQAIPKRVTNTTAVDPLAEYRKNGKEKAVFEMPNRYRRVYSKWSKWSKCSAKCITKRFKKCKNPDICGKEVIREVAYCYTEGSFCQTWIDGNVQRVDPKPTTPPVSSPVASIPSKHQTNSIRPYREPSRSQNRQDTNAISNDVQSTGRGYWPEINNYKCGLATVRNKPRHRAWDMVRILGGKPARKGQWPWQVVILNRFEEPFCGGTLISPQWVLTAAHCVRKKLFVRLGEHNLEIIDNTEVEFRVEASFKHLEYDKRTVDNDVAMLRLPREVTPSMFIGFACLPQRNQQLPKQHQCTIIGWGKRKDTDALGTNILHEAEVPIIPNEDCKKVYHDYKITRNMFCAGHRRGRIDTCSGDSGGPLLCRDTTQLNQPWTIFGITSFGDGCGKRNKFGIYAKLPNYVDWIRSVIDCNGYCNSTNTKTL